MESLSQPNPITELLNSPRGRWQVVVITAIAVVGIAIWLNIPKTIETCELVQGCELKKSDLQKIQVVLSRAGLNDFEVSEQSIQVPKQQRDLYLQAVVDANALPPDLVPRKDEALNLNPFLSRSQQEQVQLLEKKKQIREMVTRLPFVEQAWFEMDRTKSRSSFQQDEQAAVILIQPQGELRLENSQVETIRGLITGAVAGIERSSIVVTDLNAGVAFQNTSQSTDLLAENMAIPVQSASSQSIGKRAHYENAIRKSLEKYEGLQINVEIEQIEATIEVPNLQARTPAPVAQVIQVGTNSQATVSVATPEQETVTQTRFFEKIKARIGVPESFLIHSVERPRQVSLDKIRASQAYQSQLTQLKSEISSRVQQILPASSFGDFRNPPIQIDVIGQVEQLASTSVEPWYESALAKVGGLWGGLAVLLGAFVIVAYIFSSSSPEVEVDDTPAIAGVIHDEKEIEPANNEESIKQEVSRLIKEDPEAAAQVIKRWIRDAA
jgi:hypothetical protein